ncbi:MAG TPA: CYCXC family (seleno)protein [Blastocatellia bacterium]|nr:CYCXC family (seleno)protein [Blastocatellia bacterium]
MVILAALINGGCGTASDTSTTTSTHTNHATDSHAAHQAAAAPTPRIPAFYENAAAAKPFPKVLDPAQFKDPIVSKAYYLAQLNPELFSQQPCYCYCDQGHGHRSLLDCYVSDHGAGCMLCIKEGYFIDKMHKEGRSAGEIRDLVVRGDWQTVKLE